MIGGDSSDRPVTRVTAEHVMVWAGGEPSPVFVDGEVWPMDVVASVDELCDVQLLGPTIPFPIGGQVCFLGRCARVYEGERSTPPKPSLSTWDIVVEDDEPVLIIDLVRPSDFDGVVLLREGGEEGTYVGVADLDGALVIAAPGFFEVRYLSWGGSWSSPTVIDISAAGLTALGSGVVVLIEHADDAQPVRQAKAVGCWRTRARWRIRWTSETPTE